MITIEEACQIALKYYEHRTTDKIAFASDTGKAWLLWAGPRAYKPVGGPLPVLVNKESGKLTEFDQISTPLTIYQQIVKAPEIPIPQEYAEP
jgi:hypothetical protein